MPRGNDMEKQEFMMLRALDVKLCALLQTEEGKRLYRGWIAELREKKKQGGIE